jgi:hypothetical protein
MPQVAILGEQRLESWSLTDAEWDILKGSYKVAELAMVCGQPGLPKTSSLGLKFFAHKPGMTCDLHEGADESPEHLRAKAIVADAARQIGWSATVEFPGPDRAWIADVFLERGSRRLAVEIQWSRQSNADFRQRQERYEASGLECIWFAGPANAHNTDGVPSYSLSGTVDSLELAVPDSITAPRDLFPLAEATSRLLSGVQGRIEAISTHLEISTALAKCWNEACDKWLSFWYLSSVDLETRCGQVATIVVPSGYEPWATNRPELPIQTMVTDALLASDLPRLTFFDSRFSKIADTQYQAQICPHCKYVQGDGFIAQDRKWSPYRIEHRARFRFDDSLLVIEHRCVDAGRGPCAQFSEAATYAFPSAKQFWHLENSAFVAKAPILPPKGSRRATKN